MNEREQGDTRRGSRLGYVCQKVTSEKVFSLMREGRFLAYRRQSRGGGSAWRGEGCW